MLGVRQLPLTVQQMTNSSSDQGFPEIETRKSFLSGLVGLKIANRYEVTRVLGEGGMGVVAEARHTELEQRVAIKFMFPEFLSNEVLSARFAREAKLAAKVQSPHIVRVTDVGRLPSGVPYLVMDLLNGHDLGAELDEKGVLPVERAVDYVLQAAAGIAALHSVGAIHRDLKPSNLFVADVAGASTVMVLDFGISKDVTAPSANLTSTETQLGTPMYMSPEQIRASKNVDTRSDIWSLGVILYELLTGTLPFERSGHSIGELFAVILMTEPIPLCMRRPDLPIELEEVVMRCLRRNSWDRWESVGALAEALRPFARATSLHRIDTVRRALGTAEPSFDVVRPRGNEPTVSASEGITAPPLAPPVTRMAPAREVAQARTPGTADLQLDVAAPARPMARPHSPQASPSLVSSSRSVPQAEESSSRRTIAIVGASTLFLGAAIGFVGYATSTSSQVEPALASPAATTVAPPAPTDTPATATAATHDTPAAPLPPSTASSAPLSARAVPPSAPATKPPPPVVARPQTTATHAVSPPVAAPPRPSSTDDLIDSRK